MSMTINAAAVPVGGAKKPGFSRTVLVIVIIVVVVGAVVAIVAGSLFLSPSLSVTKKNFTPYTTPVSQSSSSPSSMTVSNTNGGVTTSTWPHAYLMINGTVTARGFGSSPDVITFSSPTLAGTLSSRQYSQ
jgi:hypothetical protein